MYLSEREGVIIDRFYKNLSKIKGNDVLELIWDGFRMCVTFDTDFEDEDEETEEEFQSFVFKLIKQEGVPTFADLQGLKEGDLFLINYHNFPKEIRLNGEVIS